MTTETLALTGARVAVRSGLVHPVGPFTLARMTTAVTRTGAGLAALAAVAAARWPDQVAVIDDDGHLTYRELWDRVERLAGALEVEYGAGPSVPVAVLCRNHRGFVLGVLAAARLGADVLLLNTEFPGPQLAQVLDGRRLGVVIADVELVDQLDTAGCSALLVRADGTGPRSICQLLTAGRRPHGRPSRQGALTILTSGTTGTPKGAPRTPSPRAFAGVAVSALGRLRLRANDTMLIAPPLFHGFGMAQLAMGIALGSSILLHRRFDAVRVLDDLERYDVDHLAVVPVMLQRLLAARGEQPDVPLRLRSVLTGAAPLSPALAGEFMDVFGDILFNGYGSSEVGIATIATPADLRAAPGTVGRPVIDTALRILDSAGAPVGPGVTGDIFVRSPMSFGGYEGGGSKRLVGSAMSTGDRGSLDRAGRLSIAGREDDMIVSGGENVYPQEVEDVLATHPAVADVAVIGVEDAEFGQRLVAYVVLRRGQLVSTDELAAHVKSKVARYKAPREIVLIEELPRNPTGKVLKRALPR